MEKPQKSMSAINLQNYIESKLGGEISSADIEKDIAKDNAKSKGDVFSKIFYLVDKINRESIELSAKLETFNVEKLKLRGKTTKQRLASEVKMMSRIRKNMSLLEKSIIGSLDTIIKNRKKRIAVISKRIVSLMETPVMKAQRKTAKIIYNAIKSLAILNIVGITAPLSAVLRATGSVAGEVGVEVSASVADTIIANSTDPLWYESTGELIKDGVLHGATDLTNPDWYSWRTDQINSNFIKAEEDLTNPGWWAWRQDQIERGLNEGYESFLASPFAETSTNVAPEAPAEATPVATTGTNEAEVVAETEVQTGGGVFFRTKPKPPTNEELERQNDILIEIFKLYKVYIDATKKQDEEYNKFINKNMNKFSSKGKTQRNGFMKSLIEIPEQGSKFMQSRRTRKARKQVDSGKKITFFGRSFKVRSDKYQKNIKTIEEISDVFKNLVEMEKDIRKKITKEQYKQAKKLKKPLKLRDINKYKSIRESNINKVSTIRDKREAIMAKLEKAQKNVSINERLTNMNYAESLIPRFARQQKKRVRNLKRRIERFDQKIGKYERQNSEIEELLVKYGTNIEEEERKDKENKKQQAVNALKQAQATNDVKKIKRAISKAKKTDLDINIINEFEIELEKLIESEKQEKELAKQEKKKEKQEKSQSKTRAER